MSDKDLLDTTGATSIFVTFFRWFVLNVIIPLFPLFFVWFLLRLSNKSLDWTKSTDLLFFTVFLTISAIGDISSTIKTLQSDLFWNIMFYGMIIGLLSSMGFYGLLVYNLNSTNPDSIESVTFRRNLFPYVVWMVIIFIFASSVCKYFVAKVERRV